MVLEEGRRMVQVEGCCMVQEEGRRMVLLGHELAATWRGATLPR